MKQEDPTGFGPIIYTRLRRNYDMINVNWLMLVQNRMQINERKERLDYQATLMENFAVDIRKQANKL